LVKSFHPVPAEPFGRAIGKLDGDANILGALLFIAENLLELANGVVLELVVGAFGTVYVFFHFSIMGVFCFVVKGFIHAGGACPRLANCLSGDRHHRNDAVESERANLASGRVRGDTLDANALVLHEIGEGVLRIANQEHEGPVVEVGEAAHGGGTVGDGD
jgi:hypothetical protein